MKIGFWLGGLIVLVAIGTGLGLFRKHHKGLVEDQDKSSVAQQADCPAGDHPIAGRDGSPQDSVLLSQGSSEETTKESRAKKNGRSIASIREDASGFVGQDKDDKQTEIQNEPAEEEVDLVDLLDGIGTNTKDSPALTAQLKLDEARVLRGNEKWDQALSTYDEVISKFGKINATKKETYGDRARFERTVTQCLKRNGWGTLANSREELVASLVGGVKAKSAGKLAQFVSPCEFVVGEISKNENEVRTAPKSVVKAMTGFVRDLNPNAVTTFDDRVVMKATTGLRTVEFRIDKVAGGWHWVGVKSNDRAFLAAIVAPR